MRRPVKLFIQILLVSVVLNLADWPYLDEIFGSVPTGLISEMFGVQPTEKDANKSGGLSKMQMGYQLLVGMQAIPVAVSVPFQDPIADKTPTAALLTLASVVPPSIDRPPAFSARA